ncbi:MAG: ERF family protein [Candidatus Nezhaarchaeales archaeon]
MKELLAIQQELKAPKGQRNNFGKYNYRSCEDILEAVKPLLAKSKCTLTLSDNIEEIGGSLFVRASATLINDKKEAVEVDGLAGHPLDKKGMDFSQITGAASSYARKYALNGLFAIDDTKDADATNEHGSQKKTTVAPKKAKPVDKSIDEKIAKATSKDELRALWKDASEEQRAAITVRSKEFPDEPS